MIPYASQLDPRSELRRWQLSAQPPELPEADLLLLAELRMCCARGAKRGRGLWDFTVGLITTLVAFLVCFLLALGVVIFIALTAMALS